MLSQPSDVIVIFQHVFTQDLVVCSVPQRSRPLNASVVGFDQNHSKCGNIVKIASDSLNSSVAGCDHTDYINVMAHENIASFASQLSSNAIFANSTVESQPYRERTPVLNKESYENSSFVELGSSLIPPGTPLLLENNKQTKLYQNITFSSIAAMHVGHHTTIPSTNISNVPLLAIVPPVAIVPSVAIVPPLTDTTSMNVVISQSESSLQAPSRLLRERRVCLYSCDIVIICVSIIDRKCMCPDYKQRRLNSPIILKRSRLHKLS